MIIICVGIDKLFLFDSSSTFLFSLSLFLSTQEMAYKNSFIYFYRIVTGGSGTPAKVDR
jgi:hypothetical protein